MYQNGLSSVSSGRSSLTLCTMLVEIKEIKDSRTCTDPVRSAVSVKVNITLLSMYDIDGVVEQEDTELWRGLLGNYI